MLVRVCYGEQRVWSEVRVPTVAARSGAPGESGADGADAGPDAAGESDARVAGDWGSDTAGAPARRLVDDGARLGGRGAARGGARAARACRSAPAGRSRRRLRSSTRSSRSAVTTAAPTSACAAAGAAEGRGDDQRVGVARGRARVAGVPESAADRRAARLCADPVRQRGLGAGARDQSRGQCAVAGDQHSARVELGAVATGQRAHAVVSGELWRRANGRDESGLWRWPASWSSPSGGT